MSLLPHAILLCVAIGVSQGPQSDHPDPGIPSPDGMQGDVPAIRVVGHNDAAGAAGDGGAQV